MKPRFYRLTDRDTGIVTNVMAEEVPLTEPKPLRLEAGKWYVNRMGEVVGPMKENRKGIWKTTHPFICPDYNAGESFAWKYDGRFERDDEPQDWDYDLIALHEEPEASKPLPPVRPDGVPFEGEEWIYAAEGNVEGASHEHWDDIARFKFSWEEKIWDYSGWAGELNHGHYALRRGSSIHRAQPWFDESQLVAGNKGFFEARAEEIPAMFQKDATYPPPESEWPEKPDAGEGMVWERVEDGDHVEAGVKIITLKTDAAGKPDHWYEWETAFGGHGFSWMTRNVFRAVPAPEAIPEAGVAREWEGMYSVALVFEKDLSLTQVHGITYANSEDEALAIVLAEKASELVSRTFRMKSVMKIREIVEGGGR